MFNILHTAPLAGTWCGYESTQWLNPPTAPPIPGGLPSTKWSITHSYFSESWK